MGAGIVSIENSVLQDRLRRTKEAGQEIRRLMKETRMNPEIRARILEELEWITDYYGAQKKGLQRAYDKDKSNNNRK